MSQGKPSPIIPFSTFFTSQKAADFQGLIIKIKTSTMAGKNVQITRLKIGLKTKKFHISNNGEPTRKPM
jgi:hypothetical protein